jgi:hypothetical protein
MGDSDSSHVSPPYTWGPLLSDSDLNSGVFETSKRYQCKYQDCSRRFSHSQSRSRHYRLDHSQTAPRKSTINSDRAVAIDLAGRADQDPNLIRTDIPPTPEIVHVVNWCQSLFDREVPEKAVAIITKSELVQNNAIELRQEFLSAFNILTAHVTLFDGQGCD